MGFENRTDYSYKINDSEYPVTLIDQISSGVELERILTENQLKVFMILRSEGTYDVIFAEAATHDHVETILKKKGITQQRTQIGEDTPLLRGEILKNDETHISLGLFGTEEYRFDTPEKVQAGTLAIFAKLPHDFFHKKILHVYGRGNLPDRQLVSYGYQNGQFINEVNRADPF